jgi:hypothetical protein
MLYHRLFIACVLAAGVSCGNIQITVWSTDDCTGDGALRPQLDLRLDVGCIKRGDVAEQLEVELLEGQREEKSLSGYQDGSMAAQSQTVVFFTSEDCDPDTEIQGAYVDNSCSNVFEELRGDKWKSYEMRDVCVGGYFGCDLDEEVGMPSIPTKVCKDPSVAPDPRWGCPEDQQSGFGSDEDPVYFDPGDPIITALP